MFILSKCRNWMGMYVCQGVDRVFPDLVSFHPVQSINLSDSPLVYGSVRLSVSLRLLVSLSPREICVISTDSTDWLFLSKN